MEKKRIITISGKPGSGKSSTGDKVAQALGYKRFSSGDFMRNIAVNMGITLNELSIIAESDDSIDTKIDDEVRSAGTGNHLVIDSRLAFHWIPNSFKVYLELPPEIAKIRVLNSLKENKLREASEGSIIDLEEVYQNMQARRESEKKRYQNLYNVDYTDLNNFDLVIDTNKNNLDEVVSIILEKYKAWLED